MIITEIENKVLGWLVEHDIDFDFESSLQNGRIELNSMIVEFILPDNLAMRIKNVDNGIERAILEQEGYKVADLREYDLERDIDATLTEAIQKTYLGETWEQEHIHYAI